VNLLVFWNELAEKPMADDRVSAAQRMNAFVDTLGQLRRALPTSPPSLRSHAPVHGVELADGYTIASWQVEADRDRRGLFLLVAASSPLLRSGEDGAEVLDRYGCADCWHEHVPAAWATGDLAVSLDSHERWRSPKLAVDVEVLDEQSDALVRRPDVVRHVSSIAHVEEHRTWLKQRQLRAVRDGRDLWDRRAELFPHVDFCREVQRQLSAFDPGSAQLGNIVRRFAELDDAFRHWDRGPIHPDFLPSKCTPETPQTLAQEAAEHTATRADGRSLLFKWHVRFTPGGGRIFFDGDVDTGRGLVGCIAIKKDGKLT